MSGGRQIETILGPLDGTALVQRAMGAREDFRAEQRRLEQFRLEERFGFNKMSPSLFFSDLVKSTFIAALIGLPLIALSRMLRAAGVPLP